MNRGFDAVRRVYARLLDGALAMRWAIVAASLLIMVAAWPLYTFSRKELAPVEDQSHISLFFEASPGRVARRGQPASRARWCDAVTRVPRDRVHVVAHLVAGAASAAWWRRTGRSASRSTEQMYGEVFGAVSQVPGLRVFPRLDPPLPDARASTTSSWCCRATRRPSSCSRRSGAVVGAGWQSGKFLYVDTDLKIDLPEARVVIDREQVADLGLDLASVGRELGTLLGGAYVNRFNFYDRSYKVIPQIGEEDRATVGPLLDLKIKTPSGELVPVSTFTRIESSTAPRMLNRFQQRNAVRVFGGVQPGVTKEEGLRVLEDAARGGRRPARRCSTTPASRGRSAARVGALTVTLGFAVVLIYLVLAAQFQSFRDPLIVLLGSVPLAISGALVFSFLDLTTINIYSQVGLITLVGLIAKNGILIVQFANTLQERGARRSSRRCARRRSRGCARC